MGAIVQARMGSNRLPGKVLKPFPGGSILEVIINKLLIWASEDISRFVLVATTKREKDDKIAEKMKNNGVPVFRGNEKDVLGRMIYAAELYQCDTVIRVTADNPFLDIDMLNKTIDKYVQQKADYAFVMGAPIGVGAEVMSINSLRKANNKAHSSYEREHVTPYIRENKEFQKAWLQIQPDVSFYNLSVDTQEQFNWAFKVASSLGKDMLKCGYKDVLEIIKKNNMK